MQEYLAISNLEGVEHSAKELDEQAYVILRPSETSVVFTRGIVIMKNYFIQRKEDTQERKKVSEFPEFSEFHSGIVEYVVEFKNEEYYNILSPALGGRKWSELRWEIQKEPFSNYSYSVMRSSVFQLIDNEDLSYLRRIVIEGKRPTKNLKFKVKEFKEENKEILNNLSKEQEFAVVKSLQAEDFHIVGGLEKSGKSSVIIALLQFYVKTKKKVLIVSSKNEVLDNILVKAKQEGVPFVRITNSPSQVHEDITDKIKTGKSFKDSEELDEMMKTEYIYASSCLGCQNNILGLIKPFDVCVVVHAEKIKEAVALGGMILAKKCIMIGTKESEEENSQESLFKRLSEELKED